MRQSTNANGSRPNLGRPQVWSVILSLSGLGAWLVAVLSFLQLVYVPSFSLVLPEQYRSVAPLVGLFASGLAALAGLVALVTLLRRRPLRRILLIMAIADLVLGGLTGVLLLVLLWFYSVCSVSC
jgi:hypothetical protein